MCAKAYNNYSTRQDCTHMACHNSLLYPLTYELLSACVRVCVCVRVRACVQACLSVHPMLVIFAFVLV